MYKTEQREAIFSYIAKLLIIKLKVKDFKAQWLQCSYYVSSILGLFIVSNLNCYVDFLSLFEKQIKKKNKTIAHIVLFKLWYCLNLWYLFRIWSKNLYFNLNNQYCVHFYVKCHAILLCIYIDWSIPTNIPCFILTPLFHSRVMFTLGDINMPTRNYVS